MLWNAAGVDKRSQLDSLDAGLDDGVQQRKAVNHTEWLFNLETIPWRYLAY